MESNESRAILKRSKLSDGKVAAILGVTRETVNRWRKGRQAISSMNHTHIDNHRKALLKRK